MQGKMTVEKWALDWFDARIKTGLSKNTVKGYHNIIFNHIVPHFKNMPISELTAADIQAFYAELGIAGVSNTSIRCIHLLFREMLAAACKEGVLEYNPATALYVAPGEKPKAYRLRAGQIKRYLEAAKDTDAYAIFYVALAGDISLGALRTLQWTVCDTKRGILKLKNRWVSLPLTAADILAAKLAKQPGNPFVFTNGETRQPFTESMLYYRHQRLLVAANLPRVSFSNLRECAREVCL